MDATDNQLTALGGVPTGTERPVVALTRAMVAGDEAAYRQFHETQGQRLYRYLLVVAGGNEEAAREALQSAFVRVVRHIKVFEDEQRFWNWLTVVARTAFLDQVRMRHRYFAFLDRFTVQVQDEAAEHQNGEVDALLLALLEQNLAALTPDERELVDRKYYQRLSVRDIASAEQITEKAVESRLTRVRQKLKVALLSQLKHEQAN